MCYSKIWSTHFEIAVLARVMLIPNLSKAMETDQRERARLEHFYTFGDVYETLEACDQLEILLGRLRRQQLLDDEAWARCKEQVGDLRSCVEGLMSKSNLSPKGPRLP